jgi:uncharacterized protein (DUF1684 family)
MRCARGLAVVALAVLHAAADPACQADVLRWRQQRVAALTAPDGWLSLVALHWLRDGENTVDGFGIFRLAGQQVWFRQDRQRAEKPLRDDSSGSPDEIKEGTRIATLIRRGDRFGVRVRDAGGAALRKFRGLQYYPIDQAYRVEATLLPYQGRRVTRVATVVDGLSQKFETPGILRFRLRGRDCELEPLLSEGKLFLIFRDQTSGKTTYPAGRYLYAELPANGRTVLDFNKAFNPPCAFTKYATCPLPPRRNRLTVAVEAGEKTYIPE